jgi:hypothetical protein
VNDMPVVYRHGRRNERNGKQCKIALILAIIRDSRQKDTLEPRQERSVVNKGQNLNSILRETIVHKYARLARASASISDLLQSIT